VFFPVRSNPTTGQYARVPTAVRRALPVIVLNAQRPLQLRAEGVRGGRTRAHHLVPQPAPNARSPARPPGCAMPT
jgi:hypothetical protein